MCFPRCPTFQKDYALTEYEQLLKHRTAIQDEVVSFLAAGVPAIDLAKEYGIPSRSTVYTWARARGVFIGKAHRCGNPKVRELPPEWKPYGSLKYQLVQDNLQDLIDLAVAEHVGGEIRDAVVEKYGVGYSIITRRLKQAGVSVGRKGRAGKHLLPAETLSKMFEMLDSGDTQVTVSKAFGVTPATVGSYVRRRRNGEYDSNGSRVDSVSSGDVGS